MHRIIYSTGLKGGIGKTTMSRNLLDQYDESGVIYQAYDSDNTNSQLMRFYGAFGKTKFLNLTLEEEQSFFIDNILEEQKPPLILVDFPAGGKEEMEAFEAEFGLISSGAAEEMGYRVTQIWNLGDSVDSIFGLEKLYKTLGENCDYVLVKHNCFNVKGYAYSSYDESSIRNTMIDSGAIEIAMPVLGKDAYNYIDRNCLTFIAAANREGNMPRSISLRTKSYRYAVRDSLSKAAHFLGLNFTSLPTDSNPNKSSRRTANKKRGKGNTVEQSSGQSESEQSEQSSSDQPNQPEQSEQPVAQ